MPKGKRRAPSGSSRSLLVILAVSVVVLAGTVWFVYLRSATPEVPDFSFALGRVGGTAVGETGAPRDELDEAAEGIRETLDDLYVGGFVDPGEWQGGRFPGIFEAFAGPAVKQARGDLPVLTLGPESRQISFMNPTFGRLHVRFLVDEEGGLTGAVASTAFAAQGEFRDGEPALAQHAGTWFMRPLEDEWLIIGYRARGTVGAGVLPNQQETPE